MVVGSCYWLLEPEDFVEAADADELVPEAVAEVPAEEAAEASPPVSSVAGAGVPLMVSVPTPEVLDEKFTFELRPFFSFIRCHR